MCAVTKSATDDAAFSMFEVALDWDDWPILTQGIDATPRVADVAGVCAGLIGKGDACPGRISPPLIIDGGFRSRVIAQVTLQEDRLLKRAAVNLAATHCADYKV